MEYAEFQFCRELHLTPKDLEEMPEETFREWLGFMQAESESRELKGMWDSFAS